MSDSLRIALAQLNLLVGDVQGNAARVIAATRHARSSLGADLPNYKVFDEKRYFQAGAQPTVAECLGFRVGLLVCEDIWQPEAAQLARADGAQLLLIINASPYEIHKQREREDIAGQRARDVGLPLAYVNLVGGQDELVFDGNSFVMDAHGEVLMRAPPFAEGTYLTPFVRDAHGEITPQAGEIAPELSDEASVYGALVLGVRDYVRKHGFPGVVVGLSGGIDSALTLAIAVDALGRECVQAVMMPSRYTSDMSLADAREQAGLLGVKYSVLSIEGMFEATLATLKDE